MEWIKTKERLPKTGEMVLIFGINRYGKNRRLRAFYAPKFTMDGNNFEGDADYSEEKDDFFIPEGWYECNEYEETNWQIDFDPTHWHPLPEPPTE